MSRRSTTRCPAALLDEFPDTDRAEAMTSTRHPVPREPRQGPRNTDDPRVFALADRMDDLVIQMRRERAEIGTISSDASAAFRATESAYWMVCEDPDRLLPDDEQTQVTAALAAYAGARPEPSPMRPLAPTSNPRQSVPLPA
jgi:hypothetical protein